LIHKANRNQREYDKKAQYYQHIIDEKEVFTQVPGLRDAGHFPSGKLKGKRANILRGYEHFSHCPGDNIFLSNEDFDWRFSS